MNRKPKGFDTKLQHSIELLQKAERIAKLYDEQEGFYLAFSGGKDSQCIYHIAKMAGVLFKAHMNFTSVDPPEVIRFVRQNYNDVETIPPKDSIYNIAVKKGVLPTMRMRWCCDEFKEQSGAGKVVVIGVRHAESVRRAKRCEMETRSRKFSGTFEGFEQFRNKATGGSSTSTCIRGKDSILISPIIEWSDSDVWYFLNEVAKVPHCSLYDEGRTRIGCIMCPMSSKKRLAEDEKRFPHVKRNWLKAIARIQENKKDGSPFDSPEQEYEWWKSKEGLKTWLFNQKNQLKLDL